MTDSPSVMAKKNRDYFCNGGIILDRIFLILNELTIYKGGFVMKSIVVLFLVFFVCFSLFAQPTPAEWEEYKMKVLMLERQVNPPIGNTPPPSIQESLNTLKTELNQAKQDIASLKQQKDLLIQKVDSQNTEISALKTENGNLKNAIQTQNQKIVALETRCNSLNSTLTTQAGQISSLGSQLSTAIAKASSAEQVAQEAKTIANTANTTANSANTTAIAANKTAGDANTTANTANTTANTANTTASTANTTANTANTTASTANTTANSANTTATTAKTKAEEAEKSAEKAHARISGIKLDFHAHAGVQYGEGCYGPDSVTGNSIGNLGKEEMPTLEAGSWQRGEICGCTRNYTNIYRWTCPITKYTIHLFVPAK